MPLPAVTAWLTPAGPDNYDAFEQVIADLEPLRRKTRGTHEVRVAIPTAYGPYLQGQMERPLYRTLGDELSPSDLDGVRALRQRFEDAGFPCDGWSVPKGPSQGVLHGQVAALFDRFYLNTEWGWPGFWQFHANTPAVKQFLMDFGLACTERVVVGWTMVPNTMLDMSLNAELRAWAAGTDVVCLETYVPEDPNLDPYLGLNRWFDRAAPAGVTQPATLMVEKGDLGGYLANLTEPEHGIHLWTLNSTRAGIAALPDREEATVVSTNEPFPQAAETPQFTETEARLIGALADVCDRVGDTLDHLATRRSSTGRALPCPRKGVLEVVNELRRIRTEQIGARP